MKKLMALVLSFGLFLLGMAPVMAAGQAVPAPAAATSLSVPATAEFGIPEPDQARLLSDDELQEVDGEWIWAAAGAIYGAIKGWHQCDTCSLTGKVAASATGAVIGATVGAYAAAAEAVSGAVGVGMAVGAYLAGDKALEVSVDGIKKATSK